MPEPSGSRHLIVGQPSPNRRAADPIPRPPDARSIAVCVPCDTPCPQHPVADEQPSKTAPDILAGTPTDEDARRLLAETDRSLLEILRDGPATSEESVIYRSSLNEQGRRLAEIDARRRGDKDDA